jgi:hypothetical protein
LKNKRLAITYLLLIAVSRRTTSLSQAGCGRANIYAEN